MQKAFLAMITPLTLPPRPTHPIVLPPIDGGGGPVEPPEGGAPVDPGYSPPWAQVPGEGGGTPPPGNYPDASLPLFPFHPIVVPPGGAWPELPEIPERERKFGYVWLPESGWTLVCLVPIPAPAKKE